MAETTTKILNKAGETVSLQEVLKTPVVAYYFSAHWCPPCQKFTPKLIELYNEWNANGKQIEIIFYSFDRAEAQYKEYYGKMPWLTLPYQDEKIQKLGQEFEVEGIPNLCIISKDGKEQLLSNNGYEDVMLKKEKAIDEWKKLYH